MRKPSALVLALSCIGTSLVGQTHISRYHEMPGLCGPWAVYSPDGGGQAADSVVWSTGHVGPTLTNIPIGTYWAIAYAGGGPIFTDTFDLFQTFWDFHLMPGWATQFGYHQDVFVDLPGCGGAVFDSPCCEPQTEMVEVRVYQDGLSYLQLTQWCYGNVTPMPQPLPFGHVYTYELVDADCGILISTQPDTVPNCANLVLDTVVTGAQPGQYDGAIELVEAIPDTTEQFPIYPTVLGNAKLYALPSWTLVGVVQDSVATAIWTGLDTGYYYLEFQPLAGCQIAGDTVYLPPLLNVGSADVDRPSALRITGPTVVDAHIDLAGAPPNTPMEIVIVDGQGRMVRQRSQTSPIIDVGGLTAGLYILLVRSGNALLQERFVRK